MRPDGDYKDIDTISKALVTYLTKKSDDKWQADFEDSHNNVIIVFVEGETESEYDKKYLKKLATKTLAKNDVEFKKIIIEVDEDVRTTIEIQL